MLRMTMDNTCIMLIAQRVVIGVLEMSILWKLLLFTLALTLGACTHLTSDTNQFYLAQSYLPLAKVPVENSKAHSSRCAAGPIVDTPRDRPVRTATKPLPGMVLQVIETSYSPTRDDATPNLSEWRWAIPVSRGQEPCRTKDASVPDWAGNDLIKVRHLLSRAQHPQLASRSNTQYFAEAMAAACPPGAILPACFQTGFLDKFIAGLAFNVREQLDQPSPPSTLDPDGFDIGPPIEVLAGDGANQTEGTTGLGRWYRSLMKPRGSDLFSNARQASECSRAFADGKKPSTQDAEVCQFAQVSLEWVLNVPNQNLPGATLAPLNKLWLLRSSDPLMLMQPTAYRSPLDVSGEAPCRIDKDCYLAKRMAQGFVHVDLLLPIFIEGGTRDWAPVGTSIVDLEHQRGAKVRFIRRSMDWLPSTIALDGDKTIETQLLSLDSERVTLRFGQHRSGGSGVTIASTEGGAPAKEDILLAPGDIIGLDVTAD